jgi:hypothetical protein
MVVTARLVSLLLVAAAGTGCAGSGSQATPDPVEHARPQVCAVGSVPAAAQFAGLGEAAARERADALGLTVRVLGSDGDCALPSAAATDRKRLNLYLEQGEVVIASIG